MFTYVIALGSNIGDRSAHLDRAYLALSALGRILKCSKNLETEPIGKADQLFLNAACLFESRLEPKQLMRSLLDIEASLGRIRTERWANRIIDLDIIMARDAEGQTIRMQSDELTLPHPEAAKRSFVLGPMREVCDWDVAN